MAFVEYDVVDRVAILRLNRPERLNALSPELFGELTAAWASFLDDDDAWVCILTGTGRAFCAGRDLKAQAESGTAPEPTYTKTWNLFGVADTDKPLIAAVNGFAIGAGWYMTIGCDIRIAAESAEFSMGEVPTGLLGPYWLAGVEGLPYAQAFDFAVLGRRIPARRLLELGVLNEVVADDALLPTAQRWAESLVALPPHHVRHTKRLMRETRALPDAALVEREMETRRYLNALDDTREAALAFAEKRPPVFRGR